MKKTLSNLLRSAFVLLCCICGLSALAQAEGYGVLASGGSSTGSYGCTLGDPFASANGGLWAGVTDLGTVGIDGIYSDGEIVVGNVAGDKALNIQLTAAMIADGAYYNVYSVSGMILENGKIDTNPFVLKYDHLINGQYIIVTINTSRGVVGSYKLSK